MKSLSKVLATAALTTAMFSGVAQAEKLDIGILLPSPIADVGWSKALVDGMEAVKAKYGDDVNLNIVENIQEGPDADRIMNKMIGDGNEF